MSDAAPSIQSSQKVAADFRRVLGQVSCGSAKKLKSSVIDHVFYGKAPKAYRIDDVEVSLVSPLGHKHFFAQEIRFVGRPLLLVGVASLKSGSIVPVCLTRSI